MGNVECHKKKESKMKVMCEFKERKDAIVLENWEVFTCLLSDKNNQKCYCTKL